MKTVIKPLMAKDFIDALRDAGVLPDLCTEVTIHAKIGDVVTMEYTIMLDGEEVDTAALVAGIKVCDDGAPGVAH